MESKDANSLSPAAPKASDLTRGGKAFLLWCLPIVAVIVGASWSRGRAWLWIPAFLVMGIACLANAARCGRVHCYFTGPLFLVAAAYVALAQFYPVWMHPGAFLDVVLVLTGLAYLSEFFLGRYVKRV